MATRRQREDIFKHVAASAGHLSNTKITKLTIIAGRDLRAATLAQARNFLDAMRGLFRWALDAQHVKVAPTAGVKNLPAQKGSGLQDVDRGRNGCIRVSLPDRYAPACLARRTSLYRPSARRRGAFRAPVRPRWRRNAQGRKRRFYR